MINLIQIDESIFFVALIIILDLLLGFWVYSANRKSKINQQFFLLTLFLLIWAILCYAKSILPHDISLILVKIAYAAVSLFFALFYFFLNHFPKEEKENSFLNKIILGVGLFLFFFSFHSSMVQSIISYNGKNIPILGEGRFIYLGLIFILLLFITIRFLLKYLKFSKKEKLKAQYFLIGFVVFIIVNFIFNIILPILEGNAQYSCIGNHSAIFFLAFTAYAIVKRELFGMKIILTSTLVSSITILLFLDTLLFTPNFSIQILKGISLFIFLIFGFYLIKSVKEEVKRREDAEILSRAKSEFISMASHQLRTPLTAIKGYTSMMLEGSYGKIEPRGKRVLSNVLTSSERLVKIIEDLLNISRIELGRMKFEKQSIDMKKMIDGIYKEMKTRAKNKDINLIWKKPKIDFPKLNIDELKIRQVVYNIVDNAIKYTKLGKIEIKLARKKSNLIISISDTGKGFSDKDREKLFELFTRGEAGTDTFVEGTGMGLFVAKKFVNLHQGKIWAESKGKDKGSVFHIELPIK